MYSHRQNEIARNKHKHNFFIHFACIIVIFIIAGNETKLTSKIQENYVLWKFRICVKSEPNRIEAYLIESNRIELSYLPNRTRIRTESEVNPNRTEFEQYSK